MGEREGKWKVRVKPETEDGFTESSFQLPTPVEVAEFKET